MQAIKPIETQYNGLRFRSRLEARWAVFFDALGVEYEYEPEGFELPSGARYLPDFRVKCYGKRGRWNSETPFDLWIEVKGKMTQEDADKIIEFAGFKRQTIKHKEGYTETFCQCENPVLILSSVPENLFDLRHKELYSSATNGWYGANPFSYAMIDGDIDWCAIPAAHLGRFYLLGGFGVSVGDQIFGVNEENKTEPMPWDDRDEPIWDFENTEWAFTKARQARFEYAERG